MAEFHTCSWCGGFTENPHGEEEKVVEFISVEIAPSHRHPKKPKSLVCCVRCYYKIFHNVLGQAMYHGMELKHLKEVLSRKGYNPPQRPSPIESNEEA